MAANDIISAVNPKPERVVDSAKVWTTLITNTDYLSGLLTLDHSLKRVGSKYPLVALYTDSFPKEGHAALDARGIPKKAIPYLLPTTAKDFSNDPRFYDCWSKLAPFSLIEYERVVLLDSDMVCLQNMDELMNIPLDGPSEAGQGKRVFAASHACVCNPLKKPHYPHDWIPENCAFTSQHGDPEKAQVVGAPSTAGLAMPNGGLVVVVPSAEAYGMISKALGSEATTAYDFSDQSLLGDVFNGRWVGIPYIYNALKTLRWKGIHDAIWRDDKAKNIHYIMSPKPWDEKDDDKKKEGRDECNQWWWDIHEKRLAEEQEKGIKDGF